MNQDPKLRYRRRAQCWLSLLVFFSATAAAGPQELTVIASIKPVHSLVAGVMAGIGQPVLLIPGGASVHDYSLRPSDRQRLGQARVVFWIGPTLESFLVKPLESAGARSVALLEAPGVERLAIRAGGAWEMIPEDGHHGDEAAHSEHPAPGGIDPHIWLDPRNARALARTIGAVLGEADPAHREDYARNAAALAERLTALERTLDDKLAPVRTRPYIVFHDAYQYFEHRFRLAAVGAITVSPEQRPGARRVQEIRRRIVDSRVVCVFSEPPFKPTLVNALLEGTAARGGALDEMGAEWAPGPEAYFQLLNALADALRDCLGAAAAG